MRVDGAEREKSGWLPAAEIQVRGECVTEQAVIRDEPSLRSGSQRKGMARSLTVMLCLLPTNIYLQNDL